MTCWPSFFLVTLLLSSSVFAADQTGVIEDAHSGLLPRVTGTVLDDAKALIIAPVRMDRRDWLVTGGALALVGGAFALDRSVDRLVTRHPSQSGHDAAQAMSAAGSPGALVGLNAGLIALGSLQESYGYDSGLKQTGLVSLEAEMFAVAATLALKEATGRAGPGKTEGVDHFQPFSGGGSFASTHAAASFAVASVIADRYPMGWLAYPVAGAVAVSRVYNREHFTSDVVAGSVIGWAVGTFLSRRHSPTDTDWHLQPAPLQDGLRVGLVIGRRF